jgi:transposase
MAKPLLPDALWERIEPLLPQEKLKPKGGRPRVSDRACLTGILFVFKTGTPWEYLPKEMGCGCGMTCWRRLRDWRESGVWQRIWHALLDELGMRGEVNLAWGVIDSCSVRAIFGGRKPGQIPQIAGRVAPNAI